MSAIRIGILTRLAAGLVLFFLAVPILIIFPLALNSSDYLSFPPKGLSLKWLEKVVSDPSWIASAWFSLKVAIMATLSALIISLPTAVAMVRGRVRFKQGLYALILLPMIVPNIISAIALFFFFSDVASVNATVAIIIGHAVLALPLAVIIISSTLQGVDVRYEQAALSMGASRFLAFRKITLPLIAPGLASAAVFAFLSSFDELLVSMFLSSHQNETLPVKIWSSVTFQLDPSIAAVSGLLVILSMACLLLVHFVMRRTN
jgi:putative spermidine/putrescine transport system permease protein